MSQHSLVVIGATGTGKSTLCNILAGRKHDDDSLFPVSGDMSSCTNKTTAKDLHWRGIRNDLPFTLGKPSKKNSGYNEFGTISLWTPPPTINSEKSNSENWSQYRYPPSLKK